ncbi:hypothetical protein H8356DRAFT_949956 [Neocallimastix lanati (nom. inval.)]|uniref:Uncharacterized protein n=1 Tax=Neocallimastix californiae TaxID=1754190 RepID=A0A1Y2AHL4_9FUNG|nr:hypothetical protein H8356DRAFT_949956 [Neocallimastix sp. JGI-2020a]ORY21962.1 hypothetical protein LY90DRAFT_515783 [Neocallimastix californiae]|eukprot:ORY21962.1 hypothetical protein LY90DRAFT_515783 [Neocallimastix californiae]
MTKLDLVKLSEATDKKIAELVIMSQQASEAADNKINDLFNNNIAKAGNTAVKALENNDNTKREITATIQKNEDKLLTFLADFDNKNSNFQQEVSSLKENHKHLFDMIQSVAGTAITSNDIKGLASLSTINAINNKLVEYYDKLETTRNTIIS